ncbi:MAG: hypothetical protein IH865_07715 [Chloroflexi bacterium]|nr:hypothetical protein [Chloroflexota bacterium]
MLLDFHVQSSQRGGQPFDIDNMCEPVFSTVINQLGWFGGRRPNLTWFRARRSVKTPSGCTVRLQQGDAPLFSPDGHRLVFRDVYTGPLPKSATASELPAWLAELPSVPSATSLNVGIRLSFAGTGVNLGDIATGVVKSTIDCLYPLLGGTAGAPDDWKVGTLQCEKGARDAPAEGVLIEVWSSGS